MALSVDTPRNGSPAGGLSVQVVNGDVAYLGGLGALCTFEHATSGSRGRTEPWGGAVGQICGGWYDKGQTTGNTSATPPVSTALDSRTARINFLAVTGLAGTVADNFKLVYATDDGSFTLTRPSDPNGTARGIVVQFRSSTQADVVFFGMAENVILDLAGGTKRTWCVGAIAPVRTASGDLLTGIVAPCNGRILGAYAICVRAPTDADVDIDANIEIGGTNVTGGVIELIAGDAVGQKKSGTSVTAANVFHAGDLIDIEGTVNTAGTATDVGTYNLYIEYETLPGV